MTLHLFHRAVAPVVFIVLFISACSRGSVGTEPISRCYPEGACTEAMFKGGLKGGVADVDAGATLYQTHCASCHGSDGKGLDKTKRVDFTSAIWHAGMQDTAIADAILRGRAPLMPPMKLSEAQLRNVIGFLRSIKTLTPSSNRPSGSGY